MQFLSTAAAAKQLGVNERHVRWLIDEGKIEAQRVGRAYLVVSESLKAWSKHPTKGRPKSRPTGATR